MAFLCFILLLSHFSKLLGHTEFIYTEKEAVQLNCETNEWQISTKSNNIIDLYCSVTCAHNESFNKSHRNYFCCNKTINIGGKTNPLKVGSGFYRCVNSLDSGHTLFPFKLSPNTLMAYVVAVQNRHMIEEYGESFSLNVIENKSVDLNCTFTFTKDYKENRFIVYWIKTVGLISTCVFSYDYDLMDSGIKYNDHCSVKEELLSRISNQTEYQNPVFQTTVRIIDVKKSDAAQYLCVVQVHKQKSNWMIIKNITFNVHKASAGSNDLLNVPENRSGGDSFLPLFATIPILIVLIVAGLGIAVCKRNKLTGAQTKQQGGKQSERETPHVEEDPDDCSPYSIGNGVDEMEFIHTWKSSPKQGQEESTSSVDPYSLVKLNDLYESGI